MHLSKLLRLDEIVSVTVPSVQQEAARDLVRAREDVRGDLMRAGERVSKLLLGQGIVYYGGNAWTGTHLVWLRKQHFDLPGYSWPLTPNTKPCCRLKPAGTGSTRRSRRWPPTASTHQWFTGWGACVGPRR